MRSTGQVFWRSGIACLAALWLLLAATTAFAQELQPVPPLTGRVVDQTGTLSVAQGAALSDKLAAIEQAHGSQVVVLIVPITLPEDIAAYAQRVGEQWKVGRRDVGDGLLIVVAKNERKVRIEVAKALEGAIPDLMAKRIISEQITPAFKAGDYAGGLTAAVDAVAARIRGEGLPAPTAQPSGQPSASSDFDLDHWLMLLFIGAPILGSVMSAFMGRKLGALATGVGFSGLGWWATSSLFLSGLIGAAALVVVGLFGLGSMARTFNQRAGSSYGWGGGGWSSGSSGGWGSGGGGDFGGGGASGDW